MTSNPHTLECVRSHSRAHEYRSKMIKCVFGPTLCLYSVSRDALFANEVIQCLSVPSA